MNCCVPPALVCVTLRTAPLPGSVVNCCQAVRLLEPEDKRTKVFYRGYDVYDPANVGFVIQDPEAERVGWKLDVTELSAPDKQTLLEYLKTL